MKQLRIVTSGISGGRSLTRPFRDARSFPSTRLKANPNPNPNPYRVMIILTCVDGGVGSGCWLALFAGRWGVPTQLEWTAATLAEGWKNLYAAKVI
jgi:hypothetical protein